jgi:hypothetical protein
MRESQMKKIIALAVAGAFVAPVMAADVTLGGHVEYNYAVSDGTADKMSSGETEVNIAATEELSGGYTITAKINLVDDSVSAGPGEFDGQGTSLAISGAIGTISIGDVSGALDATGDWTDIAPAGGGFDGDGEDHALSWKLPALADGLTLVASMSPAGPNTMGSGTGVANDASSFSATYNAGVVSVYAGTESAGDTEKTTAYGIKGAVSGIFFAYETADQTTDAGVDRSITGLALSYKLGDTVFGFENQQNKQDSNASYSKKETVVFAEYNWGSNVDVYVAIKDVDETKVSGGKDATTVGVEYAF